MTNTYIIYSLLIIGVLTILSNFFDPKLIVSALFKTSKKNTTIDRESDFLNLVSLWYQLKESCEKCGLTVASDKLDEVFPLLNGILEDDQKTS